LWITGGSERRLVGQAKIVVKYSPRSGSPFGSGVVSTRAGDRPHADNVPNASVARSARSKALLRSKDIGHLAAEAPDEAEESGMMVATRER
jgi:hypothetical protein